MFAGVPTASATHNAGVCVFTGVAGNLTDESGAGGIPNIIPDASLDIEQGKYTYNSNDGGTAICAGRFNDTQPVVANPATISSTGYYDNVLCGTGIAHDIDGSGTSITAGVGSIPQGSAGYQIPFVGGVGPLLIGPDGGPNLAASLPGVTNHTDAAAAGDTADASHANSVSSEYVGTGLVQISPGRASNTSVTHDTCLLPAVPQVGNTGDTDEFEVKGFLVGVHVG
jgi:hypothetical protein